MRIKAIITGTTGMVGEGVLLECLDNPAVEEILVINRKPGGRVHPKLREIIHQDFFDLDPIAKQLTGYNACYFCLGISSVGLSKEEYKKITQDLTLNTGNLLASINPDMTFCYVSGAGTDSTEQGRIAWARVKGATENALMRLFRNGYMFRPGAMKATRGQKNLLPLYKFMSWIYPIGKALFPNSFCTLQQVGKAMISVSLTGYSNKIIEVPDMVKLAAADTRSV